METKKEILREAVQYQANSIVSKQIIKKPNGNVTLFAFDKDESLSEHTSPFEAFVNIIEGSMKITIGGIPFTAEEGEVILLPPSIPHGLIALQKTKMLLTMIK